MPARKSRVCQRISWIQKLLFYITIVLQYFILWYSLGQIEVFPDILMILQFFKHRSFTGKSQKAILYPIYEIFRMEKWLLHYFLDIQLWKLENFYKCYTNLWENIFQYFLPRARMVTEDAYGQLKGRWRILLRKCESKKETMKLHTHACVCLHNFCIELSDSFLINQDLWEGDHRTQEEIQEILTMTNCIWTRDISKEAKQILEISKIYFGEKKSAKDIQWTKWKLSWNIQVKNCNEKADNETLLFNSFHFYSSYLFK